MSQSSTSGDEELDSTLSTSDEAEVMDDDLNSSVMNVLRYLLHGTQNVIGIRTRTDCDIESSDDSDDDSTYNTWGIRSRWHSRLPKAPEKPDTSVIDKSDFKQQTLYEAGELNPLKKHLPNFSSVPGMLCMREIGCLSNQTNTSLGQRAATALSFLPTTYRPARLLKANEKFFCGVYNKQGDLFMSACQDCRIRIFDTSNNSWAKVKRIDCKDVGWSVLDVDFSHGGNHLVYASWSEYLHICNIRGEQETHNALYLDADTRQRTGVFSVRFNADDSELVAGTNGGYIYIFSRELHKRTMKIDAHDDDLSSVCFADDSGNILYSGGEDAVVKVWDRRCLREVAPVPVGQLSGHHDSITHIDSRGDGRYLITNSKDQSIKLWDIRKFATSEGIEATKHAVSKQDWDYRWQPYVGKVIKEKLAGDCSLMTYYGHSVMRTLIRCRFSPSFTTGQRYIYSGDGMGRVIIYDALSGKIIRSLKGYMDDGHRIGHEPDVIRDVSWHPYDNTIISSGWDCSVYKWERHITEDL
ncbi:DDB1- and CUL4-associated factor 11-like [Watersipora subatra]|uniref:DDB1- and CUL4-associated factor 11-like n=1 Tax=Watersipora subatra TaxID=2589382 RepID=UPI00355C58D0